MATLSSKVTPSGVATAAQGTLADAAVQPNDSPTFGNVTATSFAGDGSGLTGIESVPASTVIYVAQSTAPTGYVKANGAALSRTTYAALFAAIGTTFGVGDGSTTFNLPDLRGEFLRGWDDGRGVDSGRGFGSAQSGELQAHTHQMFYNAMSGSTGSWSSPGSNTSVYVHTYGASDFAYRMMPVGDINSYPPTRGAVSNTGGAETRPRNIALLACIKY